MSQLIQRVKLSQHYSIINRKKGFVTNRQMKKEKLVATVKYLVSYCVLQMRLLLLLFSLVCFVFIDVDADVDVVVY